MSLLSRLFGGGGGGRTETPPETYEGFEIFADPMADGGGHRVRARIEKEVGGVRRSHLMIRADTLESADAAREATLAKARSLIDQQGETIFD